MFLARSTLIGGSYPDRAPVRPNISLGDSLAGLHAAFGVVMALLQVRYLQLWAWNCFG